MRKSSKFTWLAVFAWLAVGWAAFAQATNTPPAFDPGTANLPSSKEQFWTWGISLVTPVIIWLVGKIEKLPRPVLPLLTPVVGIALGLALKHLANLNLGWMDMAQAGTVAVFIREAVNQVITKQLKPGEASKTDAKPVDGAVVTATTPPRT